MDEDKLLADVMRKILGNQEAWDSCYIDICSESMCIDGWVNDLTPEEVQVLQKVYKEVN